MGHIALWLREMRLKPEMDALHARTKEINMLAKWMDTMFAPKQLRTYIYTGRHRAARVSKPAYGVAGASDLLVR
ncbi:hypothetical protein HC028_07740 [Planosporangium flavigriseum]|uniref:Uncharacterized protein n=1 Tax=Planosporangium flavigriseum TaxID=373681 RepID=A0A8J3PKG4_9ACTN|nr:hypothetical protein [Planosporangium flavigriseum]NJC64402.1 hypothetical protein [Planosporangium flavigriseum]GIG72124.1 hypothetical protein Pfl04_05280 [Planosporangium flavigriseum]